MSECVCISRGATHAYCEIHGWLGSKPSVKQEGWEQRFDDEFEHFDDVNFINAYGTKAYKNDLKSFIRQLLQQRECEVYEKGYRDGTAKEAERHEL